MTPDDARFPDATRTINRGHFAPRTGNAEVAQANLAPGLSPILPMLSLRGRVCTGGQCPKHRKRSSIPVRF